MIEQGDLVLECCMVGTGREVALVVTEVIPLGNAFVYTTAHPTLPDMRWRSRERNLAGYTSIRPLPEGHVEPIVELANRIAGFFEKGYREGAWLCTPESRAIAEVYRKVCHLDPTRPRDELVAAVSAAIDTAIENCGSREGWDAVHERATCMLWRDLETQEANPGGEA